MGRDITKLHPRLQVKLEELKALCLKEGLKIGIGECLRTVAEQDALYAQGRTQPGSIVTNGRGSSYQSQHQWGIAFDFYRADGLGAYNTTGRFFERVGEIAKSLGLGWGGDWSSLVDRPHVYLPDWGSTPARLKVMYGTPEKFFATWKYESPKPATGKISVLALQKALLADGYRLPVYGADGFWGKETEAAAQKAIVKVESPTVFTNRTKLIQQAVGVTADGYYGKQSKAAVQAFQKERGLTKDGVVGIKTWKALLGV